MAEPILDGDLVDRLHGFSLREWSELLYHAGTILRDLDPDASCYAARASGALVQRLAELRASKGRPALRVVVDIGDAG